MPKEVVLTSLARQACFKGRRHVAAALAFSVPYANELESFRLVLFTVWAAGETIALWTIREGDTFTYFVRGATRGRAVGIAYFHHRNFRCRGHVTMNALERLQQLNDALESEIPTRSMLLALLEIVTDGLAMVERDGSISYCNDGFCHVFGYNRDELLGQNIDVLVPQSIDHAAKRAEFWRRPRAMQLSVRDPLPGVCKDGSTHLVKVGVSPVANRVFVAVRAA